MHTTTSVWALMVALSGPASPVQTTSLNPGTAAPGSPLAPSGPASSVQTTSLNPEVATPRLCAGSVTFKNGAAMATATFNAHVRADGVVRGQFKYMERRPNNRSRAYTVKLAGAQLVENAPGQPGAAVLTGRVVAGDGVGRELVIQMIDGGSPARTRDFISIRGGSELVRADQIVQNQVFSPVLRGNIVVHTD